MRYLLFTIFLTLTISPPLFSQNDSFLPEKVKLPLGLGISNQMKYSFDTEIKREIFENWFNIDYNFGALTTGFRFETFQPNDPNPAVSRGKEKFAGIPFRYARLNLGNKNNGLEVVAGNFYSSFGRGLLLKIYEDRNLRIDNNLDGIKLLANYSGFALTAFSGMAENDLAERKEILHGIDLEYKGIKKLKAGVSFVSNQPEYNSVSKTELASLRVKGGVDFFDFYTEIGAKFNEDIKNKIFNGDELIAGKAIYLNGNFYINKFSISAEYKYYDNFLFSSSDGTIVYNTPPALRKDYNYTLMSRHPSALNASNEKGFQIEANVQLFENTGLTAQYSITNTLPVGSYYQRINSTSVEERTQLKEGFFQANHKWGDLLATIVTFGYKEELDSDTKNYTGVIDNQFHFGELNTFKFVLEHQITKENISEEKFYISALTLEYLRSNGITLALVSELKTTEPIAGYTVRQMWNYIRAGYKLTDYSEISLIIGTRQAGVICIGGVCRYEPEFRGIELRMITNL